MSRFTVNVLLAAAAIAFATFGILSFFLPIGGTLPLAARHHLLLHFYDGRFRLFWIETADGVQVSLEDEPAIRVSSLAPQWPVPYDIRRPIEADRSESVRWIRLGSYRSVSAFGGAWRSARMARRPLSPSGILPSNSPALGFAAAPIRSTFVRVPVWLPCVLLLYHPIRAVIRGTRDRHRLRNNLCLGCGYLLHGLVEPRCPECGTAISTASAAAGPVLGSRADRATESVH